MDFSRKYNSVVNRQFFFSFAEKFNKGKKKLLLSGKMKVSQSKLLWVQRAVQYCNLNVYCFSTASSLVVENGTTAMDSDLENGLPSPLVHDVVVEQLNETIAKSKW